MGDTRQPVSLLTIEFHVLRLFVDVSSEREISAVPFCILYYLGWVTKRWPTTTTMMEARLRGVRARSIRLVRPVNRVRTRTTWREREREKKNSGRFCSRAGPKRREFQPDLRKYIFAQDASDRIPGSSDPEERFFNVVEIFLPL